MTQLQKAVALASVMVGIALLAAFGFVPESVAQFTPIALLALFPTAWLGRGRCRAKEV